jgi:hypothetical protein
VSNHQNDDGFTITVNLEVPGKTIHPAELRLIQAHLGELLRDVIRDTEE